jgi:hypothetical protein
VFVCYDEATVCRYVPMLYVCMYVDFLIRNYVCLCGNNPYVRIRLNVYKYCVWNYEHMCTLCKYYDVTDFTYIYFCSYLSVLYVHYIPNNVWCVCSYVCTCVFYLCMYVMCTCV